MSETKKTHELIYNAFMYYCTTHELVKTQPNFPQHLLDETQNYLINTFSFKIEDFAYLSQENTNPQFNAYKINFFEHILNAHQHLVEIMHYYSLDKNTYYNYFTWFMEHFMALSDKQRLNMYETNLSIVPSEEVLEDYAKRNAKYTKDTLTSFVGSLYYKESMINTNIQFDFMTYLMLYSKYSLDYDKQTEFVNSVIEDYKKIKNFTDEQFQDKYASTLLFMTRNDNEFKKWTDYFNIDYKKERKYDQYYLSNLTSKIKKTSHVEVINQILRNKISMQTRRCDGVRVENILFNQLFNIINRALDYEYNQFSVDIIQKRHQVLFNHLDAFKKKGLDLDHLLHLPVKTNGGEKFDSMIDFFENKVSIVMEKFRYNKTPETDKLMLTFSSDLRLFLKPLTQGKKIKL